MNDIHVNVLNSQIKQLFITLVKMNIFKPQKLWFYARTFQWQKTAIKKRNKKYNPSFCIPAILILSITNRCNLKCKGCYIHAQKRDERSELNEKRIQKLFDEALDLGISIIFIAGGEPLLRNDILTLASRYKRIIFPVLSNGTLLNDKYIRLFNSSRNLVPVLSIEGHKEFTENRRGHGIYNMILDKAKLFHQKKIFFGFSITLTRHNSFEILNYNYIDRILQTGCRLIYFVEYVPENESDSINCMTNEQKELLKKVIHRFRKKYNALFISLPGEEEQYGGCLAAGRGFIHISANGSVEPCPFAPYSNTNINNLSLEDALQSDFITRIRNNHDMLTESVGGCALWENKDWVEKQLNSIV